ncbi:MAG: AAA family ATPase, partial [Parabacteroides sp.]|nr:AAA family ATPase [Parabacteroides sp.]
MNRKYPIGIQSFENIRKEGYLYVDKTALIYQLVQTGKYYFLSRPRRFGKSLLLSTLQAYYEGKKELFEGLAMASLEKDWKTYPVLLLDLNARRYEDVHSLVAILNQHLESWETVYGDEKKDRAPEERFAYLIEKICRETGHKVVVLIDEYDKPMLQAIHNKELQSSYRNIL